MFFVCSDTPKTERGKEMATMLVSFCHLSKSSANTIVVNFGVSTMDKLADFREEHWKDTFILSRCSYCPCCSKMGSGAWHWPAITTVGSSGPLVFSCSQETPRHFP